LKPIDGTSNTEETKQQKTPAKTREERIKDLAKETENIHKRTMTELWESHQERDLLQKSLKDADSLIAALLDENMTLTTLNYLRALHREESSDKLLILYKAACQEKEISDILLYGSAFRGNTATSHHDILKLAGFVKNMQITDDLQTRTYAKVTVPGTPPKDLKGYQKIVEETTERKRESKKKLDL
jgi:hypothetical protein